MVDNAPLGPAPGWAVLALIALGCALLLWLTLRPREGAGEMLHDDLHV